MTNFRQFFKIATGHAEPHAYQMELACGIPPQADDTAGVCCTSRLISVPTGMGKTAAVTLAWLWNRVALGDSKWPRRLVYCLPMRTLVEQTQTEIKCWLQNLAAAYPGNHDFAWLAERSPVILMGGEDNDPLRREWDIYPEKPAIIIGTQDMLLSRALNRGYGMARARWPMHFALLNNDCLWVMDETQLMDVGLATSAQLQAFRQAGAGSHTWWMSATLQPDWLRTPETGALLADLPTTTASPPAGITKQVRLVGDMDEKAIATLVASANPDGTTIIILNTVKRAVAVFDTLNKNKALVASSDIHLAHSRFRPADRAAWRERFLSRAAVCARPRIIVATQVVEAGVDISADILITELAPWTSLVQRFGRAARYGGTACIHVIEAQKAAPYEYAELEAARAELAALSDVSIASLVAHEASLTPVRRAALYPYNPLFLLLRHELEELFDTSTDLSGADIDVSRFIRSGTDTDCQIAWIASPPAADYQPSASELCPVPIEDARRFTKARGRKVWRWDYLDRAWRTATEENIFPGMILMALADSGGYTPECGFLESSKAAVPLLPAPAMKSIADAAEEDESLSETDAWQTIAGHGAMTARFAAQIADALSMDQTGRHALAHAARYHDIGKAHPAFKSLLLPEAVPEEFAGMVAKAPPQAWRKPPHYQAGAADPRPGFRHELASALALLLNRDRLPSMAADNFDLLLYLVAAHHGKVRASMQASPYDQTHPVTQAGGDMPIRGIMEGDILPAVMDIPGTRLTLAPASIGLSPITGASWTERIIGLLQCHGPFRLAYLEALLRAADARASKPAGSTDVPRTPASDVDAAQRRQSPKEPAAP